MDKHRTIYCKSGISVIYSDFINRSQLREQSGKEEEGRVWVFSYGLEGESGYCDRSGEEVRFSRGQSVGCIHQHCSGCRVAQEGHVKQLRVSVREQELATYFGARKIVKLAKDTTTIRRLFDKSLAQSSLDLIKSLLWHCRYHDFLQIHINVLNLVNENMMYLLGTGAYKESSLCQRDVSLVMSARQIMDNNCTQSVGDVADECNVSEQKLRIIFGKHFGISPKQYMMQSRMNKAKSLLAAGMSVTETAYSLGYEFPNNFTQAFTKYFGQSPSSCMG